MAKLRLAEVLKKKGLSKRQFAKKINVHYNNVFSYFRPGYNPTLKTMSIWAKALGVRVRDLIDDV